jgi:hypothetical protein
MIFVTVDGVQFKLNEAVRQQRESEFEALVL